MAVCCWHRSSCEGAGHSAPCLIGWPFGMRPGRRACPTGRDRYRLGMTASICPTTLVTVHVKELVMHMFPASDSIVRSTSGAPHLHAFAAIGRKARAAAALRIVCDSCLCPLQASSGTPPNPKVNHPGCCCCCISSAAAHGRRPRRPERASPRPPVAPRPSRGAQRPPPPTQVPSSSRTG